MSDIDTSLIPDFVAEAVEHLEAMESGLLKIEADPTNTEILNGIFRNIHTIKGAAQFIGLKHTSVLSHSAENLLDLLRSGERQCNHGIVDILIQVKDRLGQLLREVEQTQNEQTLVDDLVSAITTQIDGNDGTKPITTTLAPKQPVVAKVSMPEAEPGHTINLVQESENYQEELDQELFAIFFAQLTEEITNLKALFELAQTSAVPGPLLLDCVTSLEKLKSSANYMGYERLIGVYDDWIRTIYDSLSVEEPNWSAIQSHFTKIIEKFPKLAPILLESQAKVTQPIRPAAEPIPKVTATTSVSKAAKPTQLASALQAPSPVATTAAESAEALLARLRSALVQEMPVSKPTTSDMAVAFEELTEIVADDSATTIDLSAASVDITHISPTAASEEDVEIAPGANRGTQAIRDATKGSAKKTSEGTERNVKRSVRVDADKIDTLMNQVGELIVHRSYFNQIHNELIAIQRRLEELGVDPHQAKSLRTLSYRYGEAIVSLSRTANELQEGVMKVRMLPIAQLFNRYPRLVHDLTRHSDKMVHLEMRGEDTELDKMIIEEVSDPLIHIIRNAVDHGFETTTERKHLGKPEVGTLTLDAYHESNHIVIKISDDGRGIDPRKVGAKAVEKGLVTEAELERMTPREIMRLIMQPGFSTAEAITNTSGRGVGMDVVRKNIEKLNGSVEIDSDVGRGTSFRFKIPLTLAIISALQVRVGNTHFTVPLANVEETLRVFAKDTSVIEGVEVVQLRGRTMPIFRLATLFGIATDDQDNKRFFVVVVNTGNEKVGLVVDELLGQDEVVIKPLIDYLQERSGFSGATIIGGGRISLILDVYELVKMTAQRQARVQQQFTLRRRQQMSQAHTLQ